MKTNFKIGFLLLSICVILAMTSIMGVFAAEANISMDVSKSEIKVGETFTVVISNADLNAAAVGVVLDYSAQKDLIECTDVTGVDDDEYLGMYYSGRKGAETWIDANVANDAENTNSDGIFSFGVVTGKATDFFEGKVATLTFTAKASGTVTFILTERTSGTDGFDGVVETFTLTITDTPSCEHNGEKTYEGSGEGTHKVTCALCDTVIEENANCTEACIGAREIDGTMQHTAFYDCKDCGTRVRDVVEDCSDEDKDNTCDKCARCFHASTELVPNDNGTHNVVCCECGEPLSTECCQYTNIGSATKMDENYHSVENWCDCGNTTSGIEPHTYGDDGFCECGAEKPCDHEDKTYTYESNSDGTHKVICECGATLAAEENCSGGEATCTDEAICEKCYNKYGKVADHSFLNGNRGTQLTTGDCCTAATYAAKCDNCDYEDETKKVIGEKNANVHVDHMDYKDITATTHTAYYPCCGTPVETAAHDYTDAHECECGKVEPTGWVEKDGAWYYVYANYTNATGKARLPYPTVAINGITYAPNAEDLAYADFIDAMEAWFFFDGEGKFIQETTLLDDEGVWRYIENGMIVWHPGFVTYGDQLYYFVGDKKIGGNKAADGIVYVTRGTGENTYKAGYIWFKEGLVDTTKNDYIAEIKGNLFYFENGVCLTKRGLKKLDDGKYIYIRSGGKLAIGVYYADGKKYEFDENGYSTGLKDGIVDGKYYVDGHVQYGAGLIEYNGGYIYVRSNGEVVINRWYYVTKVNNTGVKSGAKMFFGEDGMMADVLNGIHEGKYYVDNHVQYGAGLVEYNGGYIYVRSSGEIVKNGYYWLTNTNNTGIEKGTKAYFDENGMMEEIKNGVSEDGKFYINGHRVYGLVEFEGDIYYVRSNGEVATGEYYITETNGKEGFVTGQKLYFDEDGKLIVD